MIVSYVPEKKKKKNVLLLSTMHSGDDIDPENQKPEIITFYNKTKGGVDVVDRLKAEYSVSRVSFRWPLTIFYSLLNVAGINSQIIYKINTNEIITRRKYLKNLASSLLRPYLKNKLTVPNLSNIMRIKIQEYLGEKLDTAIIQNPEPSGSNRPKCHFCPRKKNRKTTIRCHICYNPICKEHSSALCPDCKNKCSSDQDQE